MQNCRSFLNTFTALRATGHLIKSGDTECLELRNHSIVLDPTYPVTSFKARNLNLDYAKKEVLWYLRGDRFDTSITGAAGAWNTLIQPDGGINSNYGQVIFQGPKQFDWVIEELTRDKQSRRAVMVIGDPAMLSAENNDHRCTMYIDYLIRAGAIHQTVHMRSNDAIFGLTNDVFFFGYLHQMVWACLRDVYPSLLLGDYTHYADSLHVYARHFTMLNNLVDQGISGWYRVNLPLISSRDQVDALRQSTREGVVDADVNWFHSHK